MQESSICTRESYSCTFIGTGCWGYLMVLYYLFPRALQNQGFTEKEREKKYLLYAFSCTGTCKLVFTTLWFWSSKKSSLKQIRITFREKKNIVALITSSTTSFLLISLLFYISILWFCHPPLYRVSAGSAFHQLASYKHWWMLRVNIHWWRCLTSIGSKILRSWDNNLKATDKYLSFPSVEKCSWSEIFKRHKN